MNTLGTGAARLRSDRLSETPPRWRDWGRAFVGAAVAVIKLPFVWRRRALLSSLRRDGWETMFEITVDESFAAGHALRGYKGKCENVHGHNYKVRVTLAGAELDQVGLLCDFVHIKKVMKDVIASLDHRFLNDFPPFDTVNPSAENIAKYFYEQAAKQLAQAANGARIAQVTVWETDTTAATYKP